jgi:chromosome partitioning protein
MAKIIVISNSKGGTGKSTLCMQFANYLASQGKKVSVLDCDEGQSVVELRQMELRQSEDAIIPWEVYNATSNSRTFVERARTMGDVYVLVDCPGSLNPNLLPFFQNADAIIIPFRYDDVVVLRTMTFVKVLNAACITAKKLFLPNYIDVRVKNPNEESIREMFRKVGSILPRIKQGVAIQRVSTLRPIDTYQHKAIMYTIEEVLKAVNP